MTAKLSGPLLAPRNGAPPKSAVVLLHGYGSDGADLIGLGQFWAQDFPETMFVAPNGPDACPINPAGYQWFPVSAEPPVRPPAAAERPAQMIAALLEDLWAQTGLGPAQTVLAGFSQGAMMALNVGLARPEPLAGIIAFSGALIPPPVYADGKAPILLLHGDRDEIVDIGESERALAELKTRTYDVELQVSAGAGHTIPEDALAVASAFLKRVLAA